jgi:hypothetical protein
MAIIDLRNKIIQIVPVTKLDTFSESVASGAISGDVTGLTLTITPKFSTSKIHVKGMVTVGLNDSVSVHASIYKDGVLLESANGATASSRRRAVGSVGMASNVCSPIYFSFTDQLSSGSATTYSVRLSHPSGITRTIYVNRSFDDTDSAGVPRGMSYMIAEEERP